MKTRFAFPMVAMLMAAPTFAQTTKTTTFDNPKYSGTRTTTVDPATKGYSKDAVITRKSDGATATRDVTGQRTDTGATVSGGTTGFDGKTTSFTYDRTRTATGSTATGSYTGRDGQTYAYNGNVTRSGDGTGYTASQSITNASGASLYNRNVTQTRSDAGISRTVTTSHAPGFHAGALGARFGGRRR